MISHGQYIKEIREYPSLSGYHKIAEEALHEKNYNAVQAALGLMKNYQGPFHFIYKFPNGYGAKVISEKSEQDLSANDSVLVGMNQLKKDLDSSDLESFKLLPYPELAQELEAIMTMPSVQ